MLDEIDKVLAAHGVKVGPADGDAAPDEAAKKLSELGYIRLVSFPGGVNEWVNTMGETLVTD